jgi:hypothetical protein
MAKQYNILLEVWLINHTTLIDWWKYAIIRKIFKYKFCINLCKWYNFRRYELII